MMGGASFPFCAWAPRSLPGCHWPGMSHGHRIYRGSGGISRVDFASPVAYAQCNAEAISLAGLAHEPLTRYTYVVRPVVGVAWLETPDLSNACEVEIDANREWVGNRPVGVECITASVESGGRITVRWSYRTPPGLAAPQEYCVYCSTSADIAAGNPSAVMAFAGDGAVEHAFDLADGVSYWFAVTARAGGIESRMQAPVGPFVADASVPDTPSVAVACTF